MIPRDRSARVEGDYNPLEIIRLLARLLLSLLFLLSAWLKAIDYPSFEIHLLTQVGTGWAVTPWLASGLIATEFGLGFYWMNIASVNRRFEQATAALLVFFSVYLGILWLKQGNGVDCGCMGSALSLTPSEALAKNLVAAALLVLAQGQRALLPINLHPYTSTGMTLALALGAAAFTTPPPWGTAPKSINKPINDAPLFRWGFPYPEREAPIPPQIPPQSGARLNEPHEHGEVHESLSGGRLTAVLSVHCGYCALAADRIGKLAQEFPSLNIQVVLVGLPHELNPFIRAHKLQATHIFHPPRVIVQEFVPHGVPEMWITAADGRQWSLTLRQITPDNIEKLKEPTIFETESVQHRTQ